MTDRELPPMGSALQKLGARLANMLDDDDWNNIEPMLLDVWAGMQAARAAPAQQSKEWSVNMAKREAESESDVTVGVGPAAPAQRPAGMAEPTTPMQKALDRLADQIEAEPAQPCDCLVGECESKPDRLCRMAAEIREGGHQ